MYTLVKNGAATQMTAASFSRDFDENIQNFTFDLAESNLTHFIASDAYNTTTCRFKMSEAYDLL
ncbi:CpsB/CapC family capsule biosynthesis tyrosine phosphatase [Lederbergia wuyishanensis]|uniref:CpsB/CapC family capsule biosynthesis tyrosine phosphatase n=1 Tax=Lederbergia wuyishanensis TaxID=1347903 RepID=UPI0024537522|nr:CpsB/CapC family capsule biosynthesis tyrosine phosphatase [Lederbergia wuyishanensis]